MMVGKIFFKFYILSLTFCFFQAKAQSNKPTQAQAEQFVEMVFKCLSKNDSIEFKSLFLKDTLSKVESEVSEMLQNRMIFSNFAELKNHLQSDLNLNLSTTQVKLITYKYKDKKSKKKMYVYNIQASINSNAQLKKTIDFTTSFVNQKLQLANAIGYNEVFQSNE